jgi:hypothetical protein
MNRCNRSLRSCTNYRRRTRGDYRLRELPFMQRFPSSEERQFAHAFSPGLCENPPSGPRNGGAALRLPYRSLCSPSQSILVSSLTQLFHSNRERRTTSFRSIAHGALVLGWTFATSPDASLFPFLSQKLQAEVHHNVSVAHYVTASSVQQIDMLVQLQRASDIECYLGAATSLW